MGHIWLIGMMGSGKTTVGHKVAEGLGVPFIDSDDEVVAATGWSIEHLFSESEAAFRSAEIEAIARIATMDDSVVATGAPWYTSGSQKWNGNRPSLKKKPPITMATPTMAAGESITWPMAGIISLR